jgi:hypothetical protein
MINLSRYLTFDDPSRISLNDCMLVCCHCELYVDVLGSVRCIQHRMSPIQSAPGKGSIWQRSGTKSNQPSQTICCQSRPVAFCQSNPTAGPTRFADSQRDSPLVTSPCPGPLLLPCHSFRTTLLDHTPLLSLTKYSCTRLMQFINVPRTPNGEPWFVYSSFWSARSDTAISGGGQCEASVTSCNAACDGVTTPYP